MLTAYAGADGRLVGLPFEAFPSLTYYNKSLFDEAGLAYPPTGVGVPYVMPDGREVPWDYNAVTEIASNMVAWSHAADAGRVAMAVAPPLVHLLHHRA